MMKCRINYPKVISQVDSIKNNVSELSAQIKILNQIEQDCRDVWKGQAADTFMEKLNVLCSEMNRTKVQLSLIHISEPTRH